MSEITKKTSFEEIISLIKQKTNLSDEEIYGMINKKLGQLSILISKEGAAQIVAKEFGVFFTELKQKGMQKREKKFKKDKTNKRKVGKR